MIRTTIIAGGLLGLGIFTAAPAMAAPPVVIDCSPPATCPLITYYLGNGPNTAAGQFTNAWTTGPLTAIGVWATGPQTALKVWTDGLGITTPPLQPAGTTPALQPAGTAPAVKPAGTTPSVKPAG